MIASSERFADRTEAGRSLAERVCELALVDPVVLALPRGGVPVALEVARRLKAPLDLMLVRKIGVPQQPELAAAAVVGGEQPELVVNDEVMDLAAVPRSYLEAEKARKLVEIEQRRQRYLGGKPPLSVEGRSTIVIDDGIATGASIRVALKALRRRNPASLILAVPVAPRESLDALRAEVDEIVCLMTPDPFMAIGLHYEDFHQLDDQEVIAMLKESEGFPAAT